MDNEGYWEYRNVNEAAIWALYADDNGVLRDTFDDKIFRGKVERRWVGPWEPFENPKGRK